MKNKIKFNLENLLLGLVVHVALSVVLIVLLVLISGRGIPTFICGFIILLGLVSYAICLDSIASFEQAVMTVFNKRITDWKEVGYVHEGLVWKPPGVDYLPYSLKKKLIQVPPNDTAKKFDLFGGDFRQRAGDSAKDLNPAVKLFMDVTFNLQNVGPEVLEFESEADLEKAVVQRMAAEFRNVAVQMKKDGHVLEYGELIQNQKRLEVAVEDNLKGNGGNNEWQNQLRSWGVCIENDDFNLRKIEPDKSIEDAARQAAIEEKQGKSQGLETEKAMERVDKMVAKNIDPKIAIGVDLISRIITAFENKGKGGDQK